MRFLKTFETGQSPLSALGLQVPWSCCVWHPLPQALIHLTYNNHFPSGSFSSFLGLIIKQKCHSLRNSGCTKRHKLKMCRLLL
jgi:hypothetical protein